MNRITATIFGLAFLSSAPLAVSATKPPAKSTPTPAVILPVGTTITSKMISAVPLDLETGSVYISRVESVNAPNGAKLPKCHIISTATVSPAKDLPLKNYILKPTTLHCLNPKDNKPLPPVRITGNHVFGKALPELQPPAHATVYLNKDDTISTIINADLTAIPASK